MRAFLPWHLQRSPLAAGVPLEGTETVEGLRTLERMRMTEVLQPAAGGSRGAAGGAGGGWRRAFQRYKGPFIEQLTIEDAQQAPKSWAVFWKGSQNGQVAQAYNLPATLDVLHERTEENFVTFLPNYLRLAAGVLLATFYLRPKALLGAAAVAFSLFRSAALAFRRQQQEAAAAAADAQSGRQQQQQAAASRRAAATAAAAADPNQQLVTAASTVVTWLLVAYTRCLPMIVLGAAAALVAVLVHCALRRAPSEYRHKGRNLLGFTWRQVVGRASVPDGVDPRALFRQLGAAGAQAAMSSYRQGYRYCRYYSLQLLDTLRNPRSLWSF